MSLCQSYLLTEILKQEFKLRNEYHTQFLLSIKKKFLSWRVAVLQSIKIVTEIVIFLCVTKIF